MSNHNVAIERNGDGKKLVWWMLGTLATILTLGGGAIVSSMHADQEDVARSTNVNTSRISVLENETKNMNQRFDMLQGNMDAKFNKVDAQLERVLLEIRKR